MWRPLSDDLCLGILSFLDPLDIVHVMNAIPLILLADPQSDQTRWQICQQLVKSSRSVDEHFDTVQEYLRLLLSNNIQTLFSSSLEFYLHFEMDIGIQPFISMSSSSLYPGHALSYSTRRLYSDCCEELDILRHKWSRKVHDVVVQLSS